MATSSIEATNAKILFSSIVAPTTYAANHDAATGSIGSTPSVGQGYYVTGTFWEVYRTGLEFSLAGLTGATLTAATLSLYGDAYGDTDADTSFNITVVSGADLATVLVAADYGDLLDDTTSWGTLTSVGFLAEAYNVLTLNATGLAAVQTAITSGVIRFGLRSSRDISSIDPKQNGGDWTEFVTFYGLTTDKKPKLNLTYYGAMAPGNIAVYDTRLHYVGTDGVKYYIQGTTY